MTSYEVGRQIGEFVLILIAFWIGYTIFSESRKRKLKKQAESKEAAQ